MFGEHKSNGASRTLRWFERTLLAFGLLLSGIFGAAQVHRALLLKVELRAFRLGQSQQLLGRQSSADFSGWSGKRLTAYFNSLSQSLPLPLALLRIKSVHLEVPVLDGTGELILNRGVGHILGTARPGGTGNVGIAGHRDGFFRALEHVSLGELIDLETMNETLLYRVNRIVVVDPTDMSVLRTTGAPSLTLVTCYPFHFIGSAPKRYIIQASLVELTSEHSSWASQQGTDEQDAVSAYGEPSFFKQR